MLITGDDLYPKTPDYVKTVHDVNEFNNKTFEEMKLNCKNLNRYEFEDFNCLKLYSNIPGCDGHVDLNVGITNNTKHKL